LGVSALKSEQTSLPHSLHLKKSFADLKNVVPLSPFLCVAHSCRFERQKKNVARPVKPLEQEKILKIMLQFSNSISAMETRNHLKNGASLKSQMSRENKLKSATGADVKLI